MLCEFESRPGHKMQKSCFENKYLTIIMNREQLDIINDQKTKLLEFYIRVKMIF